MVNTLRYINKKRKNGPMTHPLAIKYIHTIFHLVGLGSVLKLAGAAEGINSIGHSTPSGPSAGRDDMSLRVWPSGYSGK